MGNAPAAQALVAANPSARLCHSSVLARIHSIGPPLSLSSRPSFPVTQKQHEGTIEEHRSVYAMLTVPASLAHLDRQPLSVLPRPHDVIHFSFPSPSGVPVPVSVWTSLFLFPARPIHVSRITWHERVCAEPSPRIDSFCPCFLPSFCLFLLPLASILPCRRPLLRKLKH